MLPQTSGGAFSVSSHIPPFSLTHATAQVQGMHASAVVHHEQTNAQIEEKLQAHLSAHADRKLALLKQYQISPQIFLTSIVAGLAATHIVVPDMAKPTVIAYIANTVFSVAAKITDFAIGKLTDKQFADAINHLAQEGQVTVRNDMAMIIDIEAGKTLSRDQKNRLLENGQYKPNLSVPQMLGLAIGGGTILALTGTGAALAGSALTASLGATGASAAAVKLGTAAMFNVILSGPLMADFNRHRLALEQPPGTSLVIGGSFASMAAGSAINLALPTDTPSALSVTAGVVIPAIISALTSAALTYVRQPLMNGIHRAQAGALTTYATVSDAAGRGFNHLASRLDACFRHVVASSAQRAPASLRNDISQGSHQEMEWMDGPFPLAHSDTAQMSNTSLSGKDGFISTSSFVNIPMFSIRGLRLPSADYPGSQV